MINVIIISITFISIWILSIQLLMYSLSHDDDSLSANIFESRVKVIDYKPYRKFGKMTASLNGNEFEFIDDQLINQQIIERNIGNFITLEFMSKVKGLILFETVLYIISISEVSKHYDKW